MPQKLDNKTKEGKKLYQLKNARNMKLKELAGSRYFSESYLSRATSKDHREKLREEDIQFLFRYLGVPKEIADDPLYWHVALIIINCAGNVKISSLTKPTFLKIEPSSPTTKYTTALSKDMKELLMYLQGKDRNLFNDLRYFNRSMEILKQNFVSYPTEMSYFATYIVFIRVLAIYSPFISNWDFYTEDFTLLEYIDTICRNATIINVENKKQRIENEVKIHLDFINECLNYGFSTKDTFLKTYLSLVTFMFIVFNIIPNTEENFTRAKKGVKDLLLHPIFLYKLLKGITNKRTDQTSK